MSGAPVSGRFGVDPRPVNAGDEVVPLGSREWAGGTVSTGPSEVTAMQSSLTQPDAGTIPDQKFETRATPIAKDVGAAIARCAAQRVLDAHRKRIDAGAHVDGVDHEPQVNRAGNHGSWRNTVTRLGRSGIAQSMCQPPGLVRRRPEA